MEKRLDARHAQEAADAPCDAAPGIAWNVEEEFTATRTTGSIGRESTTRTTSNSGSIFLSSFLCGRRPGTATPPALRASNAASIPHCRGRVKTRPRIIFQMPGESAGAAMLA